MNKTFEIFYLFDPVTQLKTKITYKKLMGITGMKYQTLLNCKKHFAKVKCLNCYFLVSDITRRELDELAQKEIIEKEIWKPVKGTIKKYECSDYGRVREILEDGRKVILHIVHKKNAAYVQIDKKQMILSKLIYGTFSGKNVQDVFIYHKDVNKSNNTYYNLCEEKTWDNIRKLATPRSKPVIRINPETGEREEFESYTEAARESFVSISLVVMAVNENKRTIRGGYIWVKDDIKC